ncbi:poly-beta-1,6-N-acetyl-D-glucosamine biosynthesis protein PgaD [Methyloterricola oryzae]|uniref:poly-beta-1,6-N-acetyl-D-glucosamine biosynthesis protein PgaD n=1 Tax=Methyloterricola oryzae TaxID=1495050 RepID=UPI0005EBDF6B|nr:poly-beta-1,6-N-acetyl-D-glucosamine biosynthesis protein PgaD [Methyloterricola oryzae]
MTELVINAPDLQTFQQRLVAALLAVTGWLLWSYIFFPLVTLSCWLVDNDVCSQWVNFAGGYLQLQRMLDIYLQTIAALSLLWAIWLSYNSIRRRLRTGKQEPACIGIEDLCQEFQLPRDALARCRESRYTTLRFDSKGRIISLETD